MGSIDMEWKTPIGAPDGKFEVLTAKGDDGHEETAIAERRDGGWFVDGRSMTVIGWRSRDRIEAVPEPVHEPRRTHKRRRSRK